jgi:plastocyanin
MQRQFSNPSRQAAAAALLGVFVGMVGFASVDGFSQTSNVVSQKRREFTPGSVTVARGEAVLIVNDDADLRHHAYIESSKFNYDSGDQEPGSKIIITIPVAGTFEVLCAIHPKMRLVVNVK